MTTRKPTPQLGVDVKIPDYDALRSAVQALLLSLDRSECYPGYSGPLPDIEPIAEHKAEKYADLRMALLREDVTPKIPRPEIVKQLREAREAAEKFARALDALGEQAIEAWYAADAPWSDTSRSKPTIADCRRIAEYVAKRAANVKLPAEVGKPKGPPASSTMLAIAGMAANDFAEFTAKAPNRNTRHGEFPDFLARLFVALKIEASAASYVQDAVDNWRSENRLN